MVFRCTRDEDSEIPCPGKCRKCGWFKDVIEAPVGGRKKVKNA